jgi:hypothetical protein
MEITRIATPLSEVFHFGYCKRVVFKTRNRPMRLSETTNLIVRSSENRTADLLA